MAKAPLPEPAPEHGTDIRLPSDEVWEQHKGKILGGVAAFVIIAISVILWTAWNQNQKAKAREAFAVATTAGELEEVILRWPNSPVAGNAALLLAAKFREEGKLDQASEVSQALLDSRAPYPLRPAAALGEAEQVLAQKGKTDPDAAATALLAVTAEFPGAYTTPYALFTLGDLYLRTDREQDAAATFRILLSEHPSSILAPGASAQLQQLAAETPPPAP